MKTRIQLYEDIKEVVNYLCKQLRLDKLEHHRGRRLVVSIVKTISLAIFKQLNNIATKKAVFKIFEPLCSYKTLVVNLNRFAIFALLILKILLKFNQRKSHFLKYTDSTDIPVCLNKNAKNHRIMKDLADWGYSGKGLFYGLKLHITTDLRRNILAIRFTAGNVRDKEIFLKLNKDLLGLFIADSSYISKQLSRDFFIEGKKTLISKPRKNMKKIIDLLLNNFS